LKVERLTMNDSQKTEKRVETLFSGIRLGPPPAQVGDVWHRVEGSHIGDEVYEGMELAWTSWLCIKTTAQGAWFACVEWSQKKPRFALTSGSRSICRTEHEALERLIARKLRHLHILSNEAITAQDTLEVARDALAKSKRDTGVSDSSFHTLIR
jgi:hypothetical protein